MIKTEYKMSVNASSSFVVCICKTYTKARDLADMLYTQQALLDKEWHSHVTLTEIVNDCRVPSFFWNLHLYAVIVEHNFGDGDHDPDYTLYIAD